MNEIYVGIQLGDTWMYLVVENDTSASPTVAQLHVADYFEKLIAEGKPLRFQSGGAVWIYSLQEVKKLYVSADTNDKSNPERARLKLSDLAPDLVGQGVLS